MTREERKETIEYLKKYRELDKQLYQTAPFTSVAHSALVKCLRHWDMAIKALSQEPCDDAISRQYLLENCVVDKVTMPYVPISKIQEAPPVTQKSETVTEFADRCRECGAKYGKLLEQKSGKWIYNSHYGGYYECSVCGKGSGSKHEECPNCRAKMESEDM